VIQFYCSIEFAGIFILKLNIYTVLEIYSPLANCTFYGAEQHKLI